MPRGRRPIIQLKNPVGNSSFLARYGCYSNLGDSSNQNKEGNHVTNLVGDYPDSDSDTEENNEVSTAPAATHIPVPAELPDIPMPAKTTTQSGTHVDPVIDDEVAHFLAEIDAISSVPSESSASQKLTPPHVNNKEKCLNHGTAAEEEETKPSFSKCEVDSERRGTDSPLSAERDSKYKSMFVLGQGDSKDYKYKSAFVQGTKVKSEASNSSSHSKYKSMFVKGQSEFVHKDEKVSTAVIEKNGKIGADSTEEELPEEPVTFWQQCLDEHTQFHYYWHTQTNEVTWEIPPEYTQYLLLYKEYEERLARIPPEKLACLKEKKEKMEKSEVKVEAAEEETKVSKQSEHHQPPQESSNKQTPEHSTVSKTNPKPKSHVRESEPEIPETKPVAKLSTSDKVKSEKSEVKVESSSDHKSQKHKHKSKSREKESKHGGSKEKSSVKEKVDDVKTVKNSVDVSAVAAEEDADVDFDIDDIDRALELALERKKAELQRLEDLEKTPASPKTKESGLKRASSPETNNTVITASSPKRKKLVAYGADDDSEEEQETQPEKETKLEEVTVEENLTPVPSLIKMKDEVEDQANIALGKLEFLEVTKKGLSKLQVLLLELQTRFRDWQDGGLDTDYFVKRLAEANSQLEQYEQSAVPNGWSCHWDRCLAFDKTSLEDEYCRFSQTDEQTATYKVVSDLREAVQDLWRYFYTNMSTGESRWDYPDLDPKVLPPPPPPPPPPDESDSPPGEMDEQPVSSSSATVPIAAEEEGTSQVSTTMHDAKKVSDETLKSEEIVEDPQMPEKMVVSAEEVADVQQHSVPHTVDVPVHPGEPPPPGFDPPHNPVSSNSTAAFNASSSAIDSVMTYSPESSDDVKDDFDVDRMLEETANSMASETRIKNVAASLIPDVSYNITSTVPMMAEVGRKDVAVPMATETGHLSSAVIYQPPKAVVTHSSTVTTIQPPISYQPHLDQGVPDSQSPVNSPAPPEEELSSSTHEITEKHERKEKKKKKDKEKKIASTSLTYKKKNVSSLVQKWHQVKVQVEQEEKLNEERQMAIRQKLEEWKQTHS